MQYNTYTRELVDVDAVLNSNNAHTWWQKSINRNANSAGWVAGYSAACDVDVQNIMTHEAGYWLVLDDLY
jgi:hypothetical protein